MKRLSLLEIIKYLGAENRGEFSRADLKYEVLGDLEDSTFMYQENIEEKIDVINKLELIIDIVLYYQGNKEEKINSILNNRYGEYIVDEEMDEVKKSILILEIIEKRMRDHLMGDIKF